MESSYTNSPVYDLNPTHCSVCGRPLVDAVSLEHAMGPICRKKYGYEQQVDLSVEQARAAIHLLSDLQNKTVFDKASNAILAEDSRKASNILNLAIAVLFRKDKGHPDLAISLKALHEMGYVRLAERLSERLVSVKIEEKGGYVVLNTPYDEGFIALVRAIEGRRWDSEQKAWKVPVGQKKAVWDALQSAYSGHMANGPKGVFQI